MTRAKSGYLYWSAVSALFLLMSIVVKANDPSVTFLGQTYRLGSYNQKASPMWEFVAAPQTVNNWTTLLTLVDRPDARNRAELDRLAQGTVDTYKSNGGRVLMAKTMADSTGTPYNYIVVAFDQPAQHRLELNFVRASLGAKNAYMAIYGVRISDPRDHIGKAKSYLDQHSSEIGQALEKVALPSTDSLPRRTF